DSRDAHASQCRSKLRRLRQRPPAGKNSSDAEKARVAQEFLRGRVSRALSQHRHTRSQTVAVHGDIDTVRNDVKANREPLGCVLLAIGLNARPLSMTSAGLHDFA